jgi:hypothetical protein
MLHLTKPKPPQNSIDDHAEWIYQVDPAWDHERVKAEKATLVDLAVKALGKEPENAAVDAAAAEAIAAHPVEVWYTGADRYSHMAALTVPEALRTEEHPDSTAVIGDYLTATPTTFVIRPMTANHYREVVGIDDVLWSVEAARRGLVRIDGVPQPDSEETVTLEPTKKNGLITSHWIDEIDKQDRRLLLNLSQAIYLLSQGVGVLEGKP